LSQILSLKFIIIIIDVSLFIFIIKNISLHFIVIVIKITSIFATLNIELINNHVIIKIFVIFYLVNQYNSIKTNLVNIVNIINL
jgi:hypothetical protein